MRTTRTLAPNARGGRLCRNFDFTTPDEPCGLVTRLDDNQIKNILKENETGWTHPQITRIFDP